MKVTIDKISKSYNNNGTVLNVLSNLSLELPANKIVSLIGSNGSGKSTLLNIIAGLLKPDSGEISFSNPSHKVGYVWQNYSESLFPWLTVAENIEIGLKNDKEKESAKLVGEILGFLGVSIPLKKYPYELSGGQRQIVSIARAIGYKPDILLLDEPFSALDRKNKYTLLVKLQEYYKKHEPVIFYVTHDIDEAILMGDLLVILDESQKGNKHEIKVDLLRPRKLCDATSQSFISIRNQVLDYFGKIIGE